MRRLTLLLMPVLACAALASITTHPNGATANPHVIDLAMPPMAGDLLRVHGYTGTGAFGLPVAGGFDMDGDDHADFAFASFLADPSGRTDAGEIYLIFGDGSINRTLDTGLANADILTFIGDVTQETAGSEIWMDDVTGDGLGDLLIARQNFTPDALRVGAGALTIVVGGSVLRTFSAGLTPADLRTPPAAMTLTTFWGAAQQQRLGIWVRTGDITGDGIADIVLGADQTLDLGETHRGAIWIIRGGAHLVANQTLDLANFGTTALAGHIARVTPPIGSDEYHFGATVAIADLDGNGRGEVLAAAALNRAGASLAPLDAVGPTHSSGGSPAGTLFIAWDDNFLDPWANGYSFQIDTAPGSYSAITGADCNVSFGEEILGGLDYDGNGGPDLFVGDIVGNCAPQSRTNAGSGHVFFDAASLKNQDFDLETPIAGLVRTDIFGATAGNISSDTAFHSDFDGDGFADLGITSPHDSPLGRISAGTLHVLYGKSSGWPTSLDLAAIPTASVLRVTEIRGANGTVTDDTGDTLGYSAAYGDINADGLPEVISNEMVGNGIQPGSFDVGNLIILNGQSLSPPRVPALGRLAAVLLGLCLYIASVKRLAPNRPKSCGPTRAPACEHRARGAHRRSARGS